MQKNVKAIVAAFPHTIPVMTGYIFLGMAFGISLSSKGYHFGWSILMSTIVYAGSMQFVAINLLTSLFNPLNAFIITIIVNARHLFYGISMLEKYSDTGKKKPYLVFGLTDETFSIVCSAKVPNGIDKGPFMFYITLFDQIYWILGSALGSILGTFISFDTKGIDFVMTALFVVIFINQWKAQKKHIAAIVGVAASVICLLIFGATSFIIPSMILIMITLMVFKKNIEGRGE